LQRAAKMGLKLTEKIWFKRAAAAIARKPAMLQTGELFEPSFNAEA